MDLTGQLSNRSEPLARLLSIVSPPAQWLKGRLYPGAAGSLREGIEETLTLTRLGVTGQLKRTLESTNPCESMLEIVRRTRRNVKRWSSGEMGLRWTAAGMLEAEQQFRRIIGYRDLATFLVAIERDLSRPTIATAAKESVTLIPDSASSHPGRHATKFDGDRDIVEEGAMSATEEQQPSRAVLGDVSIRPLQEGDLDAADRVMRMAFGTFLGAPDPMMVFGDMDYVRSRFAAEPSWAFAAELDDEVVGSNFATRWGSFGFFGPVTVRVDLWDRGIAGALMQPIIDLFDQWQVRQAGLFTFPQSPKHIGLYQKFGFWPQYLTPLMEKQVALAGGREYSTYSEVSDGNQSAVLRACRDVTDDIFEGLDVGHEIRATEMQALGDTVLLHDDSELVGFAVCHCGAGEAGSGACFVKFAAVRPGSEAGDLFERLLDACEALAGHRGLQRMVAGVNVARHDAYRRLLARGYRIWLEGVIMQRPNEPGYCRPDVYVIDDLR